MEPLIALGLAGVAVAVAAAAGRVPWWEEFRGPRAVPALILLLLVLAIAVFLPVTHFGQIADLDLTRMEVSSLLLGHYMVATFLSLWWILQPERVSFLSFLHLRSGDWGEKLKDGVKTGVAGWGLAVLMNVTLGGLVASTGAVEAGDEVPDVVLWLVELPVSSKLTIIAMAMFVEEAFFRGFLQPRFGLLGSSVLFALGHFSYGLPFLVIGVFTMSLVLGRAFARSGDLLPCIIGHGVFDAIQLFIVLPLAVRATAAA